MCSFAASFAREACATNACGLSSISVQLMKRDTSSDCGFSDKHYSMNTSRGLNL